MADYISIYSGSQIDEAVGKALPMSDYVIEQGASGVWAYRKWQSGVAECWMRKVESVSPYDSLESFRIYRSATLPYPFAFAGVPSAFLSARMGSGVTICDGDHVQMNDQIQLYALSTEQGAQTCVWSAYVIGRWK